MLAQISDRVHNSGNTGPFEIWRHGKIKNEPRPVKIGLEAIKGRMNVAHAHETFGTNGQTMTGYKVIYNHNRKNDDLESTSDSGWEQNDELESTSDFGWEQNDSEVEVTVLLPQSTGVNVPPKATRGRTGNKTSVVLNEGDKCIFLEDLDEEIQTKLTEALALSACLENELELLSKSLPESEAYHLILGMTEKFNIKYGEYTTKYSSDAVDYSDKDVDYSALRSLYNTLEDYSNKINSIIKLHASVMKKVSSFKKKLAFRQKYFGVCTTDASNSVVISAYITMKKGVISEYGKIKVELPEVLQSFKSGLEKLVITHPLPSPKIPESIV